MEEYSRHNPIINLDESQLKHICKNKFYLVFIKKVSENNIRLKINILSNFIHYINLEFYIIVIKYYF